MSAHAPPAVAIRVAHTSDDEQLRAIDRATWAAWVNPGPPPAADSPFFRPGVEPDDTLVAVANGEIVGYLLLGHPTPLPASEHVQMVRGLGVDPDARRSGIGRALVEAAIEAATERGARKLSLRVLGPNEPARKLYERCGFEEEGVLRGEFFLDGRDVDDHLLAMRLPR